MDNKILLLSTAALEQPLLNKAAAVGIELEAISFVQVVDITDENGLPEQIEALYNERITAVFTSANAVKAICETAYFISPDWKIYCIGNATRSAVLEYFDATAIHGIANDSAVLAKVIKDNDEKEITFFCGDKRMNTLPQSLQLAGISVNEVVVYETIETPKFAGERYDGILFFSPSGVSSFFSMNTIEPDTVLFAIGETTAKAIKEQAENKLVVGELPSKEHLLEQAIQYFRKQAPVVAGA